MTQKWFRACGPARAGSYRGALARNSVVVPEIKCSDNEEMHGEKMLFAYMQFTAKINSFPIWASNGAEITKKIAPIGGNASASSGRDENEIVLTPGLWPASLVIGGW
jgi:hypothetical protein